MVHEGWLACFVVGAWNFEAVVVMQMHSAASNGRFWWVMLWGWVAGPPLRADTN